MANVAMKTAKRRGSPRFSFRLSGSLGKDAVKAAKNSTAGLSGLVREGLALRLYGRGTRQPRRAS